MQTAKQSYNCGQSVIHFFIRKSLYALFQFFVSEVGNERRSVGTLIHEVLKRGVSALLELDVVIKRVSN